jgi:hypothetical protein
MSIFSRSLNYFTTDSQSVSMFWYQSLLWDLRPDIVFLPEICSLVCMGRPLWREDVSTICGVITQWSESLKTRNHTLLCNLRLPQPGSHTQHNAYNVLFTWTVACNVLCYIGDALLKQHIASYNYIKSTAYTEFRIQNLFQRVWFMHCLRVHMQGLILDSTVTGGYVRYTIMRYY